MPEVVEIREARVSEDWELNPSGRPIKPRTIHTTYRVIVDGKLVDSFMSRERAEARAIAICAKAGLD